MSADTIYALSSGRPPAAIGVVRISGPQAGDALRALIGRVPEPRKAALAKVRDPADGEVIDEALVLWFPAPRSETGEDTAELQLHGGRAVIAGVFAALAKVPGLRPAEAGEFTRRAFENGQLDLTAVEGLADLIAADTAAQRRQAYRQLKGWLGERAETWRRRLIEAQALVEARIDFSDEADVPEDLLGPALAIVRELYEEMSAALQDGGRGERLRDGLVVAIAGPPNAGKSTLLNRLAQRDVAIVSPIPGTTRDAIEVHLDVGGYPITLVDTAGVRESADPIEQEGVRRARARADAADLVLWVVDGSADRDGFPRDGQVGQHGVAEARDERRSSLGSGDRSTPPQWLLRNKIDLIAGRNEDGFIKNEEEFSLSAVSGQGVDQISDALSRFAGTVFVGESGLITRQRHRDTITQAHLALQRIVSSNSLLPEEILAEELRMAAQAMGRLTGRVDVEDILDVIFRDFCIGK